MGKKYHVTSLKMECGIPLYIDYSVAKAVQH